MPLTHALNRDLAAMSQSVTYPSQTDQLELTERSATNQAGDQVEPQAAASISDLRFDLSQPITTDQMTHSATSLMGLLFADVDRMLERGVVLEPTTEAGKPEAGKSEEFAAAGEGMGRGATLEALLASPFGAQFSSLAPKLSPRDLVPSLEPEIEQPPAAPEPEVSDPVTPAEPGGSAWLVTLCGSLLLSLGLLSFLHRTQVSGMWLALLEKYRPAPVELVNGTEPAASQSASQSASQASQLDSQPEHADFLGYLQQSLERLSRQAELPPPSPDATASPAPSVIERVYVPVYPSAIAPVQPTVPTAPTAPAASQPAPRSAQRPAQTQPLPSVRPASPSVAAVPNIGAETSHTLIGVLELGERSAALFEVNGTPKRIEVGEQVGSSGWTLVSISNQEAIVRRNGEVRSIYVGQKF
ncbi:MAG: hypothetical protein KME07_23640 [Pegethrix bostrychoides GSE-TBD4-15B]|jgi:hypothetical protein|uniref:Type II secretion system protein GspC N-terminal domain-containing protein n=1 Tax=Pegethrix bostrychoides GSE-TBD4-15B TaxID=2839662 RepID=A0A951PEU8_9CYAN|nr:hypothetical protein [Pegethrix bostrychoides GSE-TBD4-15B]